MTARQLSSLPGNQRELLQIGSLYWADIILFDVESRSMWKQFTKFGHITKAENILKKDTSGLHGRICSK